MSSDSLSRPKGAGAEKGWARAAEAAAGRESDYHLLCVWCWWSVRGMAARYAREPMRAKLCIRFAGGPVWTVFKMYLIDRKHPQLRAGMPSA
jgi:hypothetical protein